METLYEREAIAELAKPASADSARFDEESLAHLPFPVRRHLERCGWAGRAAPANARIRWEGFRLKRGRDKAWMDLDCRQFNSAQEPMRLAYMGGRLMGFIPFDGRDKFQDGHGHMLVKAMGAFKVVDEQSRKLDESGLVTVLAEALLVPGYALRPYIRWQALDSASARAYLTWNGIEVNGIFRFAESGECFRFDSDCRWQQGADSAPIPWSALMSWYGKRNGVRFPTRVSAVWHERSGDFEYVQGRIAAVDFDVKSP